MSVSKTRVKIIVSEQEGYIDLESKINSFLEANESILEVVEISLKTFEVSTEKCALIVYNSKN